MSKQAARQVTLERRPELTGGRSLFNLSYDHKTTFNMGELIPFFRAEVLPHDTFYIRAEFMFRFAALYVPLMHRVTMRYDWYYVPNRILWFRQDVNDKNAWEQWIMGRWDAEHPTFDYYFGFDVGDNAETIYLKSKQIPLYLGAPSWDGIPPNFNSLTLPFNALPVWAYYAIWSEYERNDQIQTDRWESLSAGNNNALLPIRWNLLMTPLPVLWNRDMYTICTYTTQLTDAVQIPLQINYLQPDGLNLDIDGNVHNIDPVTGEYNYNFGPNVWRSYFDSTRQGENPDGAAYLKAVMAGVSNDSGTYMESAGDPSNHPVYLDIQETAATITQLRYAIVMEEFLERSLRVGDRYRDFIRGFFDLDPSPGFIDRPVWIGGGKARLIVSEVLTTAETTTENSRNRTVNTVGGYAGQALLMENSGDVTEYSCREHGWIIGTLSVMPDSSYFTGMQKVFDKQNRFDYAFEEFALIGDEPVLTKEIAICNDEPFDGPTNQRVFGYRPRYTEYRIQNDTLSGSMKTIWSAYTMTRFFRSQTSNYPILSPQFVQGVFVDMPRNFNILSVENQQGIPNEDGIFAYIWNDVRVRRKLPKYGTPKV